MNNPKEISEWLVEFGGVTPLVGRKIQQEIEAFVKERVAAAEEAARESMAKIVDTWVAAGGEKDDLRGLAQCMRQKGLHNGQLARALDAARREERERVKELCAKICDVADNWNGKQCASAIRSSAAAPAGGKGQS